MQRFYLFHPSLTFLNDILKLLQLKRNVHFFAKAFKIVSFHNKKILEEERKCCDMRNVNEVTL